MCCWLRLDADATLFHHRCGSWRQVDGDGSFGRRATVHCRPAQLLLVMEDQEHTATDKGKGNKDLSVILKINGFREQGYF